MPELLIKTCGSVPNYDALEAVAKYMMKNYQARTPKRTREIKTDRGYLVKVEEPEQDERKSRCSGTFLVQKVNT